MTHDQIRAFVAVVENGSFRSAAEMLFKTQPTISSSVRSLEEQFDIQLFDRNSYRPTLTEAGKAFYRQAKQVLTQAGELEMLGHQLAKGEAPTLSLSISAMCASPPGLEKIKQFSVEHPNMRLNITTEHLSGVLEQLLVEKAELAMGPHLGMDDRYEFVEISRIKMMTVVAPNYLNVDLEKEVTQKILRKLPHILISDTGSVAPFDHVNVLVGGQRWYVNDYQMKKSLLLAGMGWARIPEHIIEHQLQERTLIPIQVENFNSQSHVPIYLIRLKDQPLSQLAKEFWQQFTD